MSTGNTEAEIVRLYDDGYSIRAIARAMGLSRSAVHRRLTASGLTGVNPAVKAAAETNRKRADAARAQAAAALIDDLEALRARAWSPAEEVVSTPDGAEVVRLEQPPLREVRAAYAAIEAAVRASSRLLDDVDRAGGDSETREALSGMHALFRDAVAADRAREAAAGGGG